MSDFDEKLPQDGTGGDLDGLSLDDLLRSAKEELARADRLIDEPPQETAGVPEDAPESTPRRSSRSRRMTSRSTPIARACPRR